MSLKGLSPTTRKGRGLIKTLTHKIITAGCLTIEAVYPRRDRRDAPRERAAKAKATNDAQRALNLKNSTQQLELMLAANFPTPGSGLVIVLSYDDKHLPKSRKEAQRRFKYFLQKLRAARKAAGLPSPRVFFAPEVLTSATGRWHHHIVMDNTGDDLDMLRACWIYGSDIDCRKLRVDRDKNHETQARYMSKELREAQEYDCRPGLHGWSCTRNCLKPDVETFPADAGEQISPPAGAEILTDEHRQTEFAAWRVVKYRVSPGAFPKPPKARRRRRRW